MRTRNPTASRRLLARLAAGKGNIVSVAALLLAMYDDDEEPETAPSSLRVLIHKLRRRLPPGAITTHYAVGYSLDPRVAATLPDVDERVLVPG